MTNIHIWTVLLQSTSSLQDLMMAGKPFKLTNHPIILTRREATAGGRWINYHAQYDFDPISWFTIMGRVVQ